MLKTLVNEAHLVLSITTTGPLLIKSGYSTVSGPDMTPMLTYRNGQQEIFLPGSSLKGIFRSHVEKVVGSLKPRIVCDPFLRPDREGRIRNERGSAQVRREDAFTVYRYSCGSHFEWLARDEKLQDLPTARVYRESCPTCRLFGSTSFIGRIAISDAHLSEDGDQEVRKKLERRDGVGIDRLTGGASDKAKFELEVVTTGVTFETMIHLRNFETWQLGMLFVVIQDMEDELIRIGSGRSRGLGNIKATISEQEHSGLPGGLQLSITRGIQEPDHEIWGIGRWLPDESIYGTERDDVVRLSEPIAHNIRGIRNTRTLKGAVLEELKEKCITNFVERMERWEPAPDLTNNGSRKG